MRSILIGFAIPLFDRRLHHSSVPTMFRTAAARRFCPGRPNGRREAASPWTDASTAACSLVVGGLNRILSENIASFGAKRRRQVMVDQGGLFKSGFEKPVHADSRRVAESGAWCNDLDGCCHTGELR